MSRTKEEMSELIDKLEEKFLLLDYLLNHDPQTFVSCESCEDNNNLPIKVVSYSAAIAIMRNADNRRQSEAVA